MASENSSLESSKFRIVSVTLTVHSIPSRSEDDVSLVEDGEEDKFIASQFQDTFAELDEDSEDMDETEVRNIDHAASYRSRTEIDLEVPVTIIDEIPEVNIYTLKVNANETTDSKEHNMLQGNVHCKAIDQSKNNYERNESRQERTKSKSPYSPGLESHDKNPKQNKDPFMQGSLQRKYYNGSSVNKCEQTNELKESKSSMLFPSTMLRSDSGLDKERPELFTKKGQTIKNKQIVENNFTNVTEQTSPVQKIGNKASEPAKASLWRQQTYEPKFGMRTFTVVPPKPDVKKYDRDVSISASAIKIDDLGNLINPQSSFDKKYSNDISSIEIEGPLVEKAKEFWRSNSMDKQVGASKEQPGKNIAPVKSVKLNHQEPDTKFNPRSSKGLTQQTLKNHASDRVNGVKQNKLVQPTIPQEKMIILEHTNKLRTDLPFLKPTQRTSSQYVASAIFKNTEPSFMKSLEKVEAIQETYSGYQILPSSKSSSIAVREPNIQNITVERQETSAEYKTLTSSNVLTKENHPKRELTNTSNVVHAHMQINKKNDKLFYEHYRLNGSLNILQNKSVTVSEQKLETIRSVYVSPPYESQASFMSGTTSNAFLKAVRDKSAKLEQSNSFGSSKEPALSVIIIEKQDKPDLIPSTIIDETDRGDTIFGPKAKLRPVLQKPVQKDMSLHSALMDAIQSGEGKEKLRKIQSSLTNGEENNFAEAENERSALLSAIRAHNGLSRLKKVSSAASDELQRDSELQRKNEEQEAKQQSMTPPPLQKPPPPPPIVKKSTTKVTPVFTNNSVEAREALMEAIRSGSGASKLKKVSASVHTL
ncbi:protein cordon-bleu-like [Pelobates fuscus]|uniref:protein cordon-bleu-like n=1 Tax=Pelobates fuscus TaxID=191477 RepID=UPI002FE4EDD9